MQIQRTNIYCCCIKCWENPLFSSFLNPNLFLQLVADSRVENQHELCSPLYIYPSPRAGCRTEWNLPEGGRTSPELLKQWSCKVRWILLIYFLFFIFFNFCIFLNVLHLLSLKGTVFVITRSDVFSIGSFLLVF